MSMCSRNKDGEQIIIRAGGAAAAAAPATMRKGPWTEEEDAQLVRFVRLFGERRWDFLAKVSGLRRTGKSCRLRWVNYLHPGLRRGRITADEERLIVQLHAQWGTRWSRIARSLPGRTDNEIKNFWRTRTRKKALEERRHGGDKTATAASPLSSSVTTASCCPGSPTTPSSSAAASSDDSALREGSGSGSGGDDAELEEASTATAASQHQQPQEYCCTMDQLWNEIAAADAAASYVLDGWGAAGHCYYGAAAEPPPMPSSPVWEYSSDYSLWRIDDEEYYRETMLDAS
ncbi:hypothetical protein SEVIR_3G062901v4 [Setaria viridis]|uniref:Uncharacterized protein n=1 Tax=Setaria italica TaxID=4555 RepID=K3ZD38_SETIT|nr:hypothetical protein SETIT_3G062200v2 [Setaria italica]